MTAHIVCVDDEQAVLDQLSAQLTRRFGATHRVECAESAEEAILLGRQDAARGNAPAAPLAARPFERWAAPA